MRCNTKVVDLQQPVLADDASAGVPHPCARQEQLRERVGELLAASCVAVRSTDLY